jgi:hypothetical protein
VFKTFGGARAHLPVCYAGASRFLVAETLPGKVDSQAVPFPQAQCATFLLGCATGRVIARTEPVAYDHNPPLVLPKEWRERYGVEFESGAASTVPPPYR